MRRPLRRQAACTAALLALTCLASAQPGNACPPAGARFQPFNGGDTEVFYRWEPGELRVGQFFLAEVIACQGTGSTRIALDATMPAHGHGMNYRPNATEIAPGHYRFSGLMLHMPGRWQITVDLYDGARLIRRLTRNLDLKP